MLQFDMNCPKLAFLLLVALFQVEHGQSVPHSSSMTLLGKTSEKIFYATKHQMTWPLARDYCSEYGFQLASIENADEQAVVDEIAVEKTEAIEWHAFWLAGHDATISNNWRWNTTGFRFNYTNWAVGYPVLAPNTSNANNTITQGNYLGCVSIHLMNYTGTWQQTNCFNPGFYPLCMLRVDGDENRLMTQTTTARTTTVPAITTKPLSDMIFIGRSDSGKQFYTRSDLLNFTQTQAFCAKYGLSVGVVETLQEGILIGTWATAQGLNDIFSWLVGNPFGGNALAFQTLNCLYTPNSNKINANNRSSCQQYARPLCAKNPTTVAPTTTLAPTTTIAAWTDTPENNYNMIRHIGTSDTGRVQKTFWGYRLSNSFWDSYQLCEKYGLRLATLETREDQDVLSKWAVNNMEWSGFWTAGTNMEAAGGNWTWITTKTQLPVPGQPGFQNWEKGQPTPYAGENLCLVSYLVTGPSWYATPCWQGRSTLCESRLTAAIG